MSVSITFPNVLPTFPIGSTVGLYVGVTPDAGVPKPTGAQISSAVVAANGSLTFTGLSPERKYVAAQLQGQTWRFIEFTTGEEGLETGVLSANGQIGNVTGLLQLKGNWNASTNVPSLVNGTGTKGDLYYVTVGANHDFGAGTLEFEAGDMVFYDGTVWRKIDNTVTGGGGGAVSSVNGKTGAVAGLEETSNKAQSITGESEAKYLSEKAVALGLAGKQPLDSDLTAIAALATTSFGRELLTMANAAAARTALALGTAATQASTAFDAAGAASAAQAASQPLDSDLTAIAALATTEFGRSLLTQASAAAARTTLGLGTAATQASTAFDAAGAASAAQAASQPLDSDLTAIAALTTAAFGRELLELASAAAGRTKLGLGTAAVEAASAFQPADADLTAIAALATNSFGRGILTKGTAAEVRAYIEAGTGSGITEAEAKTLIAAEAQPKDSDLTAIAALATTEFGRSLLTLANAAAGRTALEAQKTLGAGDVTATMLATSAVEEGKIAGSAVTNAKIANGAVSAEKLELEAVQTSRIKDLNVTAVKLANEAVETLKIKALNVTTAKIAEEAVTEAKLSSAVKTKLTGANAEPRGFAVISTVEAVTYRGFYEPVTSGVTKKLVGMKYSLGSGTSAKITVKQNGAAVTGFKELEAKSTEALEVSGKTVAVAAGDRFDLTVEAVTGTPKDLIVTLFFEVTH